MGIPNFNERGKLPTGIHKCKPKEFIKKFCYSELDENTKRITYVSIIQELISLSVSRGAESIIFGGSFITNNKNPNDIDCLVIVASEKSIPARNEHIVVSDCELDIMYISKDNEKLVYSMINLFAKDKYDLDVGLVEVKLSANNSSSWSDYEEYSNFEDLLNARAAYENRHVIRSTKPKGIIVSIHGFNTDAQWNCDLAPIVSSNNWIFAPYSYGNVKLPLIKQNDTKKVIDNFRDWIHNLKNRYELTPNIIAHSFGTYILGKYIQDYNFNPPVRLGDVILTGSILHCDYDWKKALETGAISSLYNIISPNDNWVKIIEIPKFIKNEKLYGTAGVNGFTQKHRRIFEENIAIFDHVNMLKNDVFEHRVVPYFDITRKLDKIDCIENIDLSELLKRSKIPLK